METRKYAGNNWYKVWNISGSYEKKTESDETQAVPYSTVVISDDDNMRTYQIQCKDQKEAAVKMTTLAFALDMAIQPLWVILRVRREELPPALLEYELKRCKHCGINIS